MNQFQQYFEARSNSNYVPERDDYLNWKDDWNKAKTIWDDGTHTEERNGTKHWRRGRDYHRDDDKPAYIGPEKLVWYKNGKIWRENDKPNVINNTGLRSWYKDDGSSWVDVLHRDNNRPAKIYQKGNNIIKEWYKDNERYFPEEELFTTLKFDGLGGIIFYLNKVGVELLPKLIDYVLEKIDLSKVIFEFIMMRYRSEKFPLHSKVIERIKNLIYNDLNLLEEYKDIPEIEEEFYGHVKLGEVGL